MPSDEKQRPLAAVIGYSIPGTAFALAFVSFVSVYIVYRVRRANAKQVKDQ